MIVSLSLSVLEDLKITFDGGLASAGPCRWSDLCRIALRDRDYEFGMNCPVCHPWIPRIIAVNHMIQYIHRYKLERYDLPSDHRYYRLLKDNLPENSEGEIDSHFYTFVPKERIPLEPLNMNAMAKFCQIAFENPNFIRWSKWVIESGKHKDRPNPHIHVVIKFNGQPKNWQRDVIHKEWKKIFTDPNFTLQWKRQVGKKTYKGVDRYACQTARITDDKIAYMDNDKKNTLHKGTDHTNFIDLGINGGMS